MARNYIKKVYKIICKNLDPKFVKKYSQGEGSIFMLHRVADKKIGGIDANQDMKVSQEYLEKIIKELTEKGYEFISLDTLYEKLKNRNFENKFIAFTLDDGYKDNYEVAYPLFKKYNIPFTIYVTTSFPERTALLWWEIIEKIVEENNFIETSDGEKYTCRTIEDKNNVFLILRNKIISFGRENLREKLIKFFKKYEMKFEEQCEEKCMNWEQIIELSKDSLVTIGAHTITHPALNKLSEDEIIYEVTEGRNILEKKIGKKIEHFAYPYGSSKEVGRREFDIVKKLNFKTITTTRKGNIFQEHENYMEALPRIQLIEVENIESQMFVEPLIRNMFEKVIVD